MRNLLFWQRWPTPERTLFNMGVFLFLLALGFLLYYYSITPRPVVDFQTIAESQLMELPFESFRVGIFDMVVPANYYTVTERLLGTVLEPNLTASNIWLVCFAVAITGLLAVVTTASRYYYLAAMGVFILLVVSMKMETLLIFGRDDRLFSIAVMVLYGACSFYIYYFRPEMKFAPRFLWLAAVTIVIATFIALFSRTEYPSLHVATYSFQSAMIACVLFIVTVSHEIVASFITILTRTNRSGKTLNHFLIITLIYLLNLVLAYMIRFEYVRWNVITVNLFLLLCVSAVLGLWGLRQRQKQMEGIIDIEPHALTGYIFLGAMALGAIAWFMGTANDPAYQALADVIIFCHLGYGFIFVFYVISNFSGPLQKNMAVHKILYSPMTMPFFTFRLAGLITTLFLLIYNSWQVPAHNAVAGYQNQVADMYLVEDNQRVAAVFYDQGRTYGYSNHHSNYALANIAGLKFDHEGEKGFYKAASYRRPTEMSYLNWAQMFQSEDKIDEAIEILREGLQKFPRTAALRNTLGLLYAAQNKPDSAAQALQANDTMVSSNRIALAARNQMPLPDDVPVAASHTVASMTNQLALASVHGRESDIALELPSDSSISAVQAAYLNNYLAHHPGAVDTVTLSKIERITRLDANTGLREPLLFACALSHYSLGEIQKAFSLMEEVAITSANKGKYNNILALWSLEQGDPVRAKGFADYSLSQGYIIARYTHAVALTEQLVQSQNPGAFGAALNAWDSVAASGDSATISLANRTTKVLTSNFNDATSLDDLSIAGLIRYRLPASDTTRALRLIVAIKDDNLRATTLLGLSRTLLQRDDLAGAANVLRKTNTIQVTEKSLKDEINLHHRIIMAEARNIDGLRSDGEAMDLSGRKSIYKTYFDALIAETANDTVTASNLYDRIIKSSWFFDEGLLAAGKYFQTHSTDVLKSYKILADAMQHHPSSIRLRKAYIREAKRIGFTDFVEHAMDELKLMLPEAEYRKFSAEIGG